MDGKLSVRRFYFQRNEIERILFLSCGFSILLWAIRFTVTGSLMHGFLIWNLFLAYIPYQLSKGIANMTNQKRNAILFWLIFFVWLVFIPNSFYIITDLFHLEEGTVAPLWYDLVLIFSFAWNGIIFGILSLYKIERIFEEKFKWGTSYLSKTNIHNKANT